jgi:2,5-diamino-6-(ribosylamino)-4(3H)-pyrimidinone 5'-phosphate reductase
LKALSKKKIKTLLVEGGGTVNWEFVKLGLVDEVIVTITPYLVGGQKAISLVDGEGFSKIQNSKKLKLKKICKLGNEIVLHYNLTC